ncbi:DUF4132 domain-containing protein [Azonexus sp.]|uniref:DUF4132 domain-containing protein n=1 Tax=Azonexus sp. TaxID=1872668 RepID=UPI0035AEE716
MSKIREYVASLAGKQPPAVPRDLSKEQQKWLEQAFAPLACADKGMPDKVLNYVLTGGNEAVLHELRQSKELGSQLGQPGRLHGSYHGGGKLTEKSMAARARFYASLDADAPPLGVMVRLGKVLTMADAGESLEDPGAPVPTWCQYLVNDAMFASLNHYYVSSDMKALLESKRGAFSLPNLLAMLKSEEEEGNKVPSELTVLQLVFERQGLTNPDNDALEVIVDHPATLQFMRDYPQLVAVLPRVLAAAGRVLLANFLGRHKELAAECKEFGVALVALAVDSGKTVRAAATPHLDGLPEELRMGLLAFFLQRGEGTVRQYAADLLVRWPSPEVRATLEAALAEESSKSVQHSIRGALGRLDVADDSDGQDFPPLPDWTPLPDEPLGPEVESLLLANRRELLENYRLEAEEEKRKNAAQKGRDHTWRQRQYKEFMALTDDDLRLALKVINGQSTDKELSTELGADLREILEHEGKIFALPAFGGAHHIRWRSYFDEDGDFWPFDEFHQWLLKQPVGSVDLRALADVVQRSGYSLETVARASLVDFWRNPPAFEVLPPECVWPFFAEHPEFIDAGLNTSARLDATIRTIGTFPVIPGRWLPRLMEIALGEAWECRAEAQKVLGIVPDIGKYVLETLTHSKSEMRIEAACWLANLQYQPAVEAIRKALVKESREAVRAAFLTALEELGADIAAYIAPDVLLAEARKGLKARLPAGFDWFNLDALPACHWADGTPVEADCIKWWVVFACKLKWPGGNPLLRRYLGLLDAASREALGRHILHQFIAQDTRHPSEAECIAYADAYAPGRWQQFQGNYRRTKDEFYNRSQEQIYAECKASKAAEYLGSAIGEKGILALSAYAPGHEAVNLLRQYMRDHYPRRAQIEAMLEGLAPGNDPFVIQLLLGLSRRYRTASVQEKARLLVQQIADRNGWSADQLADRTIPTAGFDDSGKLELHYGDRLFTVTLDAAMKPELRNAEGKVIKALPEPRQTDDPDSIKEAKGQFSGCKKELKQVIELQTARLYEALCVSRLWPQAEWREYLLQHPVVGRLIQRLIWLETDAQGQPLQSFRPTEDGTLINTDDDEITLNEGSLIRLAHASLVTPDSAKAWQAHFKDYKLTPLFAQMTRPLPEIAMTDAEGKPVQEIADRQGWLSDTFTLRGAFNKLGYQRAAAEDGGYFNHYFKEFGAAGIRVVVEFTGNCLPEENVAAALRVLRFEDTRGSRWQSNNLDLASVPVVLLAEAYADYLAVANVCSGFDPEWEKKSPWY